MFYALSIASKNILFYIVKRFPILNNNKACMQIFRISRVNYRLLYAVVITLVFFLFYFSIGYNSTRSADVTEYILNYPAEPTISTTPTIATIAPAAAPTTAPTTAPGPEPVLLLEVCHPYQSSVTEVGGRAVQ